MVPNLDNKTTGERASAARRGGPGRNVDEATAVDGDAPPASMPESADDEGTDEESSLPWLVLWTRRPVCGRPTEVIDRLGKLRSAGTIAGFDVETWPGEMRLEEMSGEEPARRAFRRFEAWAEDEGCSLRPPFEVRTVSPLVGRERTVVRFPMMCLAVYEGSTLSCVYPRTEGTTTLGVGDYLDELTEG